MNVDFERTIRGAGVAGWWAVLASAAVTLLQWAAYLLIMSWRPAWFLSLWGSTSWLEVQHLWLLGTVVLKIFVFVLAVLCLWLTLWARELRKRGSSA